MRYTRGAVRNAWLGHPVLTTGARSPTATPAEFTPQAMLERQFTYGGGTSVPRSSPPTGAIAALGAVRNAWDDEPQKSAGTVARPTTLPASLIARAPLLL